MPAGGGLVDGDLRPDARGGAGDRDVGLRHRGPGEAR